MSPLAAEHPVSNTCEAKATLLGCLNKLDCSVLGNTAGAPALEPLLARRMTASAALLGPGNRTPGSAAGLADAALLSAEGAS